MNHLLVGNQCHMSGFNIQTYVIVVNYTTEDIRME